MVSIGKEVYFCQTPLCVLVDFQIYYEELRMEASLIMCV